MSSPNPEVEEPDDVIGEAPSSDPERKNRRREDRGEEFKLPTGFENDETAQLIARAKHGDAEALNELFATYHTIMVEVAPK